MHCTRNKAERKTARIKEQSEKPREDDFEKTCLSSALRSWNPLSQLSGWWTSREPQWPADSPGFGAQRVGSRPPNNPQKTPPPCHMHPSSHRPTLHPSMHMAFHSIWLSMADVAAGFSVCTHLPNKSWRFWPTVTVMPSKNVIVGVIGVLLQAQTNTRLYYCVCEDKDSACLGVNPSSNLDHHFTRDHINLLKYQWG